MKRIIPALWPTLKSVLGPALATTLLLGVSIGWIGSADAAAAKKEETHAPTEIDPVTGKKLNDAIELVNQEKYAEAKATLGKLNMEKLSPYEKSRVYQMYASIASAEQQYDESRKNLELAIQSGGMGDDEIQTAQYSIAQLFMVQERWSEGITALKKWFETAQNPNASAYYLLAIAYYRTDNRKGALEPAQKAVDMSEKPQPNWIELLLALRLEAEQYDKALPLLKYLVSVSPEKRTYWMQLSAVYRQMERYEESLAVIQCAQLAGFITEPSDIKSQADLNAFVGIPYRGAKLLQTGIDKNVLETDEKLWERLSNMWIAARDYGKALAPLKKAAALHENGDLYVRLAELHVRNENWADASDALRSAFAKGNLKDPANSELLMGIALYSQKKTQEARTWFVKARDNAKLKAQADSWIRHIDETASS